MVRHPGLFDDSEFDWDAYRGRQARPAAPQPATQTSRLAWAVLVLLTFCPLVGFVLATGW